MTFLWVSNGWTCDGTGNMLTYTDRKEQTTTYTPRDALGRFAEVTYADGSTITADTYDNGNRLLEVHRLSKRRDLAQLRRPEPSDRNPARRGRCGAHA
ncbi:hypothetical protein P5Y53_04905 [Dyella jiangningensis]|uniref:hypothetical protein n=1 Tax=Dyella jiangningensis TaxID=1379159 RepID=UPI00240FA1F0|nr:hypothetical protein [Dyella jiangningensis]MDG2536994.1 hypothetical protein [Dyella jiangningensis]